VKSESEKKPPKKKKKNRQNPPKVSALSNLTNRSIEAEQSQRKAERERLTNKIKAQASERIHHSFH
jgi:hypothetical protein